MAGENHDKNQKDGPWGAAIQSQNTSQSSNINDHNIDLKLTLGGVYAENQVEKTPLVHSTPSSSSINGFNYQPHMAPQEIPPSRLAAEQVANNEAFRRAIGVIKENNSSETPNACTQAFIASARYKQAMPTNIAENERQVISSYFSPPSSMVFPHRNIKGKPVLPFNFQSLAAPIELCNTPLDNGKQLVTTINPISRPVMITDCGLETRSVKPFEDEIGSSSKKAKTYKHFMRQDSQVALMQKMPSVTSTGGIPNGKKIEGFLYKYGPDRVVIVCLCHGRFLCPAEFVKHAGGGDIENPMKHIKILVQ